MRKRRSPNKKSKHLPSRLKLMRAMAKVTAQTTRQPRLNYQGFLMSRREVEVAPAELKLAER
jgi:hypothetical protein